MLIPKKILIERGVLGGGLARRLLRACPSVPVEVVRDRRPVADLIRRAPDPIGEGKKYLWLTRQRGAFIKPCPCTPGYVGCGYFIINAVWNCPLDCSYCILQGYLNAPAVTVFTNLDDLWRELDAFIRRRRGRVLRLGTGELGDSLALEPLLGTAGEFISFFRARPGILFEFKTKTTEIDAILKAEPAENVVVSWSLNSEKIARDEENGATPVRERLEAAARVARRGFPVGFHFDPLILYPGWEDDYRDVIDTLGSAVPAARIRWVSLGSLRFPPPLKTLIARRFPRSSILSGELVPGRDGKLRYFKPLRLELYHKIVGFLEDVAGARLPLYLCMEDAEVWKRVLTKKKGRKEVATPPFAPSVRL
jgi:spore photoproduct lyase